MTLVTLADAKLHLHMTDPARDAEVTTKLNHASAIVFDRLDQRADPEWTELTAPEVVQAAVLLWVGYLWEHRGDDLAPDNYDEAIWAATDRLLRRLADPALA